MQVQSVLEQSAAIRPNKVALICGETRLTYEQINRHADQVASGLQSMGIKARDRIIVYMDNSAEAVISIFAVLKANSIFVILNPDTKARKLGYIISDSSAKLILSQPSKKNIIETALAHTNRENLTKALYISLEDKDVQIKIKDSGIIDDDRDECRTRKISKENTGTEQMEQRYLKDLAGLIYTSGSSGKPKGVMSAHRNMLAAIDSITRYLENDENDIILNVLPLSFDYGLYQLLMTFYVKGTLVLEKSFAYPYNIFHLISKEKVTGFPVVPTMVAMMLGYEKLNTHDFRSLRYVTSTGSHFPIVFINKLQSLLPHAKLFCMYGLTECKRVSYLPPEKLSEKAGSVGIPMANVKVKIVDENGQEVKVGEVGELTIRGPNVMLGYWNDTFETQCKFRQAGEDGETCLYSGDLFRMDKDGFLYFIARKDDLLKVKGERVSPKEIESVLHEMNQISEAAVIGVPHSLCGQLIKAFVVVKSGYILTEKDVMVHCAKNMEGHMVPKYIEFVKTLPKNFNCKIDKIKLSEFK